MTTLTPENSTSLQQKVSLPSKNKALIIESFQKQVTFTDGTTTWTEIDIGPVLENMGHLVEDIQIQLDATNLSSLMKYKIVGKSSLEGNAYANFSADILTEQTTAGFKVSAPYSTRTDFGLFLAFKLLVANVSGTNLEHGTFTIKIILRFIS